MVKGWHQIDGMISWAIRCLIHRAAPAPQVEFWSAVCAHQPYKKCFVWLLKGWVQSDAELRGFLWMCADLIGKKPWFIAFSCSIATWY